MIWKYDYPYSKYKQRIYNPDPQSIKLYKNEHLLFINSTKIQDKEIQLFV